MPSSARAVALVHFDTAERIAGLARVFRALGARLPGRMDGADEIDAGVEALGQRDGDLAGADIELVVFARRSWSMKLSRPRSLEVLEEIPQVPLKSLPALA